VRKPTASEGISDQSVEAGFYRLDADLGDSALQSLSGAVLGDRGGELIPPCSAPPADAGAFQPAQAGRMRRSSCDG
jgi:hypothetical protein